MRSIYTNLKMLLKSEAGIIAFVVFLGLTIWRLTIISYEVSSDDYQIQVVWGASYQVMALIGAICGLLYSGLWGWWRSLVGRANLAFSLGLFAQLFGQSVSSYYFYIGLGVPYPSLGDIGFFGSVLFYIYGAICLAKAAGAKVSLKSFHNKLQAVLIPLVMLMISFFIFLWNYQFDWSSPITVFLDFGYPLFQAFYVSVAILAFLLSRQVLGGLMKIPVLFFIFALFVQYVSDFTFLYQAHAGTYNAGGFTDYLYLCSYFLMSISLIRLSLAFKEIKNS